jgi:hypothetical protein
MTEWKDMVLVYIDFETYFDTASGFTLRKLSVPEYIGHPDFNVTCLGVRHNGVDKILWGDKEISEWLDGWRAYKGEYCFVAHNMVFDGAILAWKYSFIPQRLADTLLIANHVLGTARDGGTSNSLESLAVRLRLEAKGKLNLMDGVKHLDMSQKYALSAYLRTDLVLCNKVFDILAPFVSRPHVEMWLAQHTIKCYISRALTLNPTTVDRAEQLIEERRKGTLALASRALRDEGYTALADVGELIVDTLNSNKQFERILTSLLLKYSLPLPTKKRPVTAAGRGLHARKLKEITEVEQGLPAETLALGDKAVARWNKRAEKILATAHLVPPKLGATVTVPALSRTDEAFLALSECDTPSVAALVTARLILRSLTTSAARLSKMRNVAKGVGRIPVHLVYYGAHTGRYSGGGGFNFQNLSSPDRISDAGQRAIAAATREAFEADAGFSFVSVDASQIEARVCPWTCGQWDILKLFAEGQDVYSVMISRWIGEEIRKPTREEEASDDPVVVSRIQYCKRMRHIGKEAVLALGYGMAAPTFIKRLRSNPLTSKMLATGAITEDFVKGIVSQYRKTNAKIVSGWERLNSAFLVAARGGTSTFGPITLKPGVPLGSELPVVQMELPSGRSLYYRDVRQEKSKLSHRVEWVHGAHRKLYGGLLIENVTQAISRDIVCDAIYALENVHSLPVFLHVHDSVVCRVRSEEAETAKATMIRVLSTTPAWAGDRLVLSAEGKISTTLIT